MTPDEIIDDLNRKFFVAYVRDSGSGVYTRVCWQAEVQNVPGQRILCCETFTAFRKRFPKKQLIDGKLRNVGDFWLRHPRRRPCAHERVIQRVYLSREKLEME